MAAAAGDMCWMPTLRRHQLQLSLMWIAITKMEEDRLCKRIYKTARHFAVNNKVRNWTTRVKEVLSLCNLSQWWESDSCGNLSKTECKKMIVSVLFRLERDKWYKEVLSKPKLRTYRIFKQEYESEPYINVVTSRAHRAFLARLRGGSATLEIETGRYVGIPAEQRICKLCHSGIGDEAHIKFLHAQRYRRVAFPSTIFC